MNTEKLEKLKKSLDNKFVPDSMKDKIRTEIEKLESEIKDKEVTPDEIKEEIKNIEVKVEDALEVAEKKEEKQEESKPKTTKKATTGTKKTAMALAKEIRKEGESWKDAVSRASKQMKGVKEEVKKETKSEINKLKSLIRKRKDLQGISSTNLMRDGHRKALPSGKRTSASGNTYYENRRNRTDKGKVGSLYLAKGGGTMAKEKSFYQSLPEYKGYKWVGFWDGYHHFVKKEEKGYLDIKVTDRDIENGNYKDMIDYGYSYANGGAIPNNYEGKTPEQVWNSWTEKQRKHFLHDHEDEFPKYLQMQYESYNLPKENFDNCPLAIKQILTSHVNAGQYADGGDFMSGAYAEEGAEVTYMRNKDGIKVQSIAKPEKELTEAEWLAKHNESPEARSYAGGGEINAKQLDLGYTYNFMKDEDNLGSLSKEGGVYFVLGFENGKHFSESFEKFADAKKFYLSKKNKFAVGGGIFADTFTGETGTHYTGLVGETNAMSSGEMFEDGGAIANQQLIADAHLRPAEMFGREGIPAYNEGGNINTNTNNKMKKRLEKGDDVLIIGRRWFDRVNGNTYHTAEVQVNGEFIGKSKMTYGYDEQYLETGKEILLDHYELPEGMKDRDALWHLRDYGVVLHKYAIDGLKRELAHGGGVTTHNGREYSTGRNWTNDHNHVNRAEEHEVSYKRKKSSFNNGGLMDIDNGAGYMNDVYAGGGKVSPFKNMMETNTITEKEINLIKMRMNNNKVDEYTQEAIDYIWDNSPRLTPDQDKKGIDYLRNLWKSPTGKERANNPFGYREQDTLETFEYFELRGFYDAGNYHHKFYVPLYTCVGKDSNFEYYISGGSINIVG
jgi:hypothetical protein